MAVSSATGINFGQLTPHNPMSLGRKPKKPVSTKTGTGTILGMKPQRFAQLTGSFANAISPNSMGGRLGKAASMFATQDIEEQKAKIREGKIATEKAKTFNLGAPGRKLDLDLKRAKLANLKREPIPKAATPYSTYLGGAKDAGISPMETVSGFKKLGQKTTTVKPTKFDVNKTFYDDQIKAGKTPTEAITALKSLGKKSAGSKSRKDTSAKDKIKHVTTQMNLYKTAEGKYAKPKEQSARRKKISTQYDADMKGWAETNTPDGKRSFIKENGDIINDEGRKIGTIAKKARTKPLTRSKPADMGKELQVGETLTIPDENEDGFFGTLSQADMFNDSDPYTKLGYRKVKNKKDSRLPSKKRYPFPTR